MRSAFTGIGLVYMRKDIQHWVRSCERYDRDFLKKKSVKTGSATFYNAYKKS